MRKKWIIVKSNEDGHRVKLTRAEAVRFLDITTEVAPGMDMAENVTEARAQKLISSGGKEEANG